MRFQIFKREDLLAMTDRQKVDDFSVQPRIQLVSATPYESETIGFFDQAQNNRQDKYLKLKDKIKMSLSNLLKLNTINVLHLQVEFRLCVTPVNQKDNLLSHCLQLQITTCSTSCAPREAMK